MASRSQLSYTLRIGAANVMKHKTASVVSIITTTACLMLIAGLVTILWTIQINIRNFQAENTILAFVDDRLSQLEAIYLQTALESTPGVSQVAFITKEEAFEKYISNNENLRSTHLDPSILRDRYAVRIRGDHSSQEVAETLLKIDGIADIRMDEAVTKGFELIGKCVALIGSVLTPLLLTIAVIIMTNTIKLTTLARKSEIEVMKMMGAYDSFVWGPFVVEGCIVSVTGALIAFVITAVFYIAIRNLLLNAGATALISFGPFSTMAGVLFAALLGLGAGIGIIGSLFATKEYLKT